MPPWKDLLTILTRVLANSHAGSSLFSLFCFPPASSRSPRSRFLPPSLSSFLPIALSASRVPRSASSLVLIVTVSPLESSSSCALSDRPSCFTTLSTRPVNPRCLPSTTHILFPSLAPGSSSLSSFSSRVLTFLDWPSGPFASTIVAGASRLSPGLMYFLLFSFLFGAGSAPSPSLPDRGTNSTAATIPLLFLPTGLPSSHPIPRSIAAPKSSMGMDS